MEVLLDKVRVCVKERKPRTSEETGKRAEDYKQARKAEVWTSTPTKTGQKACYLCGQIQHLDKDCTTKLVGQPATSMNDNTNRGRKKKDKNLLCATTVVVENIYCDSVLVMFCSVE